MDNINYLGLGLKGNAQVGGDNAKSSNDINFKDGLTLNEFKTIDANGDGKITLEEFKKAYGGDSAEAKALYKKTLEWLNSSSKKNKDGTTTVTQINGNTTVKTTYDKNGKMTGYKEITTDPETGKKTVDKYTVKDGQVVKVNSKITNPDGSVVTIDADGKTTTKESNKTSVSIRDGKVTEVEDTNKNGKTDKVTFTYDKDGKIKSAKVKIGDKVYEGSNVTYSKDGKEIEVKDKNGNLVAKIKYSDDVTSITEYENGKKKKVYTADKEGNPKTVKEYDSNGKIISRKNAQTGKTKEYEYNSSGKLTGTTSYDAEGKKVSSSTYLKQKASDIYEGQKGSLVESKTTYDENGNVLNVYKYSYKKNEDGSVTKTVKKYDANGKEVSTSKSTQDKYGNTLKKVIKDADGTVTTKEYEYDTDLNGKVKTPKHYKKVTTTTGNIRTVNSYENGRVTHKEEIEIKDGVGTITKYDYEYFPDSDNIVKKMTKTNSDDSQDIYEYNLDGSYTLTKKDKDGNVISAEEYDKDGNKITKPTTPEEPSAPEEKPTEKPADSGEEVPADQKDKATREKEYQDALAKATTEKEKARITLDYQYNEKKIELLEKKDLAEREGDWSTFYKLISEINALDRAHEQDLKDLENG